MFYLEANLYQREDQSDDPIFTLDAANYQGTDIIKQSRELTIAEDTVLVNTVGNYLVIIQTDDSLASFELNSDTETLTFKNFFAGVISATGISITASKTVDVELFILKIES